MGACGSIKSSFEYRKYEREASAIASQKPEKALELYLKALRSKLENPVSDTKSIGQSYLMLANLYKSTQRDDKRSFSMAEKAVNNLKNIDSLNCAFAYFILGEAQFGLKNLSGATKSISTGVEILKNDSNNSSHSLVMGLLQLGHNYKKQENYQMALKLYFEAKEMLEKLPQLKTQEEVNRLTDELAKHGKSEEFDFLDLNLKILRAILTPELHKINFFIAEVYFKDNQIENALKFINYGFENLKEKYEKSKGYNDIFKARANILRTWYIQKKELTEVIEKMIAFWEGRNLENPLDKYIKKEIVLES